MIQYLTLLKCSTEKMRLKNNDMYECYLMTTFMKREEQDTLMGRFPMPRLPRQEDGDSIPIPAILYKMLYDFRICSGLWKKILTVSKVGYKRMEGEMVAQMQANKKEKGIEVPHDGDNNSLVNSVISSGNEDNMSISYSLIFKNKDDIASVCDGSYHSYSSMME